MKAAISLTMTGMLALSAAYAENFTQANTDKAKAIIEAALEAHGGDAMLRELRTLKVEYKDTNYSVDQSRATEPPWDKNPGSGFDAIDLENSIYVNRAANSGGGFVGENGTIINGEESSQLNYRAGTVAKIAEPDFATTSGPFVRVTPALLLRTLNDRTANAHYLGETKIGKREYDVIGFSMTVGPAISLYFDKKTRHLHRSERVFPGFGLVEYEFKDYETVAGMPFNRNFVLLLNGDVNLERSIESIGVNEALDDLLMVDTNLERIPQVQPDPLSRQEISDGVWLIGGNNTYAMFVDMGEYILAVGGTGGSADRIESLREVIGDKPIKYGMMTHHHFDHVMAVADYESEGATIIASKAHEKIVRRAADDGDKVSLKTVDKRMSLDSDSRRVEIVDIGPTAHTEHMLVAYLPAEGILFQADHFGLPQAGPIPPAVPSTQSFAEAIARFDFDIEKILSAHSPRIATMDDLRAALEAEVFQASR